MRPLCKQAAVGSRQWARGERDIGDIWEIGGGALWIRQWQEARGRRDIGDIWEIGGALFGLGNGQSAGSRRWRSHVSGIVGRSSRGGDP
jgi:hypothetical protein